MTFSNNKIIANSNQNLENLKEKVDKLTPIYNKERDELKSRAKIILDEVLSIPNIIKLHHDQVIIEGNNLSWNKITLELKAMVSRNIEKCGLYFDANNKLSLQTYGLLGPFKDLADKELSRLLMKHIRLHFQHYTKPSYDDFETLDQCPHWREAEEALEEEELRKFLADSNIDFTELLEAYVSTIQLNANYNIFLEKDVYLPGIDLSCNAKRNIICKPGISVNTSPKQLNNSKQPKRARNGISYEDPTLAERGILHSIRGDHGLNGLPGENAGNIVLYAGDEIQNLSSIKLIANGTNGLDGQEGGNGGDGASGSDMPTAIADDIRKVSTFAYLHAAKGKTPGLDENGKFTRNNEISSDGGDAGSPGYGGKAGVAGEIYIEDKNHRIRLVTNEPEVFEGTDNQSINNNIQRQDGEEGADAVKNAQGGEPGEAGKIGADNIIYKASLCSKRVNYVGYLPSDFFEQPGKYINHYEHFTKSACVVDPYSDHYQKQIRIYNDSIDGLNFEKLIDKKDSGHPYKNEKSRGRPGKGNEDVRNKPLLASNIEEPKKKRKIQDQIDKSIAANNFIPGENNIEKDFAEKLWHTIYDEVENVDNAFSKSTDSEPETATPSPIHTLEKSKASSNLNGPDITDKTTLEAEDDEHHPYLITHDKKTLTSFFNKPQKPMIGAKTQTDQTLNNIDNHRKKFYDELKNLEDEVNNLKNSKKNENKYKEAYNLHSFLMKNATNYFNNEKNIDNYNKFEENSLKLIESAKPKLADSRFNKILVNIALAIAGLGIFYAAACVINKVTTGNFTFNFSFFNSKIVKTVNRIERQIQSMHPPTLRSARTRGANCN